MRLDDLDVVRRRRAPAPPARASLSSRLTPRLVLGAPARRNPARGRLERRSSSRGSARSCRSAAARRGRAGRHVARPRRRAARSRSPRSRLSQQRRRPDRPGWRRRAAPMPASSPHPCRRALSLGRRSAPLSAEGPAAARSSGTMRPAHAPGGTRASPTLDRIGHGIGLAEAARRSASLRRGRIPRAGDGACASCRSDSSNFRSSSFCSRVQVHRRLDHDAAEQVAARYRRAPA